jgi:dinuclear metal center YbgI/SA1388 family protein
VTGTPTLADVVAALEARYPPALAEGWDAVGLAAGDPAQPVRRVLFAVDPVAEVADEAVAWGADLLVTHHPLFLRGVHGFAATTFKGAVLHRLVRAGVGLYSAHTNADAAGGGVADALAEAIGLVDLVPLVAADDEPAVAAGSSDTSSGRVGLGRADSGRVGLGRVGRLPAPERLDDFARRVAAAIPATAQGVRYAGDPDQRVERVAVLAGAGDSEFDAVRAADVDAYVTSDLRHHPASEARERAAFDAGGRPALVDTAHFASEWPWLARAASRLAEDLVAAGATVEVRVSTLRTDPWTARVGGPLDRKDPQ